jgi:hypothetical protein
VGEPGERFESVVAVADGGVVGTGGFVVLWGLVGEEVDELLGEEG